MNKKFSTLVACLLAATSVGTVSAQDFAVPGATIPTKIVVPGKYYQLGATAGVVGTPGDPAANVLVMEETTPGQYKLVVKAIGSTKLPNSLWKVVVKQNSEGALSYQFVNVATNMPLSLNSATAAKPDDPTADNPAFATPSGEALLVGGDINTWKWQPAVTTTATSFSNMEMYSAFGAKLDSAVTLVGTAAIADGVQVGAAKYALGNKATAFTNQVWLAPFEAGSVVLTADDLNSMLWTQKYNAAASKVKFTFDKDVAKNTLENLFSKNSYKAVPAIGFPAAAPANTGTLAAAGAVAALDTKQAAVVAAINENALAQAIKTAIDDDIATNAPVALSAAQALANVATASGTDTPAKLNLLFDAIDLSTGTAAEQAIKSAVRDALKAFVLTCTISSQGEADAVVAKTVNTGGSATGIVNKIATPTTVTAQNTALKEY